MGYTDHRDRFANSRIQHNIMALVGNGFDIQALSTVHSKAKTTYTSFYYHLKSRDFSSDNLLLKTMEDQLEQGCENWSDLENGIQILLNSGTPADQIEDALDDVQVEYSIFLDQVVTPQVLADLSRLSVENAAAEHSFSSFLCDIKTEEAHGKLNFLKPMDIGDILNFRFVNFNYTPLLDNFVYLDKLQFNPEPFRQSDRNFYFRPNPRGFNHRIGLKGGSMVSYLVTEVVHPHGAQHTPRSLLFGIDEAAPNSDANANRLAKPYWAQNRVIHEPYFEETHLFIIFGCSLGSSDRWWWSKIANCLSVPVAAPSPKTIPKHLNQDIDQNLPPDLIIYWRLSPSKPDMSELDVLKQFASGAGREEDQQFMKILEERAHVVLYTDEQPRAWLNTNFKFT